MASSTRLSTVLLVCLFVYFQHEAAGSDVRESFYNEIRNLLNNIPVTKEEDVYVPKPKQVENWGTKLDNVLGQVSGISVDPMGHPVVFHRGSRVWDAQSFNSTHHYQHLQAGPIREKTIVTLDPRTGDIISSWGQNLFFLPHGITIDHRGNTWVTDVAMHQVLKFPRVSRDGILKPTLRLGQLFTPGHGESSFCKPTSVAVATTSEIFVSDGYCNNRIMKFDRNGILRRIFPRNEECLSLEVPHSLSLLERHDLLCVADRENMRVACFKAELRNQKEQSSVLPFTIHEPDFGRVFAITSIGNLVFAINGPTSAHIPLQGFTVDPIAESVLDHWAPKWEGFTNPHDIAASPAGDALYVAEIGPNKVWKFTLAPKVM